MWATIFLVTMIVLAWIAGLVWLIGLALDIDSKRTAKDRLRYIALAAAWIAAGVATLGTVVS